MYYLSNRPYENENCFSSKNYNSCCGLPTVFRILVEIIFFVKKSRIYEGADTSG